MLPFPTLKTGAVAQYPLSVLVEYRADIVWFLDGSEQRFRNSPSVLRQWEIKLDKLDEQEMANVQQFFVANGGAQNSFAFTDPSSQLEYPNCSLVGDSLELTYTELLSGKTTMRIRQNRT